MILLVHFSPNPHVLRRFLPLKFAFSHFGLHPITVSIPCKQPAFITYSARTGQSPDRQQPNMEPTLLYQRECYWNMILFSSSNTLSRNRDRKMYLARGYSRLKKSFGLFLTAVKIIRTKGAITSMYCIQSKRRCSWWGLPRGFGDRWHCSKMWRQSLSDSPIADKNWQKKGDNLRQRQAIFELFL